MLCCPRMVYVSRIPHSAAHVVDREVFQTGLGPQEPEDPEEPLPPAQLGVGSAGAGAAVDPGDVNGVVAVLAQESSHRRPVSAEVTRPERAVGNGFVVGQVEVLVVEARRVVAGEACAQGPRLEFLAAYAFVSREVRGVGVASAVHEDVSGDVVEPFLAAQGKSPPLVAPPDLGEHRVQERRRAGLDDGLVETARRRRPRSRVPATDSGDADSL